MLYVFILQLCGAWRNVPYVYNRHMRKERMSATITTALSSRGHISGRLIPFEIVRNGEECKTSLIDKSLMFSFSLQNEALQKIHL